MEQAIAWLAADHLIPGWLFVLLILEILFRPCEHIGDALGLRLHYGLKDFCKGFREGSREQN